MKVPLAGCLALLVLLSAPLGATGPVPSARPSPAVSAEAQPLQVKILSSAETLQPGQRLTLVASVKDANGNDVPDPIRYSWGTTSNMIDLSPFVLTAAVFTLPNTATIALNPGPYTFTLSATMGESKGSASVTITVAPRPAPKAPPKLSLVCDPANRTIRPGQPLTLTAELQPAGGGVSPDAITYAWSVDPGLRAALPAGPSLKFGSTQTQGMKAGQAYVFTLKVKLGQTEIPATCTVNVAPPEPLQPARPRVPMPIARPGVKP
jgi:hypothetical protein